MAQFLSGPSLQKFAIERSVVGDDAHGLWSLLEERSLTGLSAITEALN